MTTQDALSQIKNSWLSQASHQLAKGDALRSSLQEELTRFFDLLNQAVQSGNPAWLDTLLQEWAAHPTESDLQDETSHLALFIKTLNNTLYETARNTLPAEQALDMLVKVQPYFLYGLEKASQFENERRISHISEAMQDAKRKMEQLDESKSRFISVAAHELKTPITLIEGYAAMLRDILVRSGYTHPQMDALLDGIHNGIRRLREIVDDMIDVSLIDNNMLMLNLQPLWLRHLFDLLENELASSFEQRQQRFVINHFEGDNEVLFADPERMYQALRNILLNAIKYTPDGGTVTIDGRRLPGFIEITIQDTGIGIAPEKQPLIFEKFYQLGKVQLHSSGKTKFKGGGPGLGLPIARGIIESHGGTIWVESEGYDEEKCPGTTFHILLPVRKESNKPLMDKLFSQKISKSPKK